MQFVELYDNQEDRTTLFLIPKDMSSTISEMSSAQSVSNMKIDGQVHIPTSAQGAGLAAKIKRRFGAENTEQYESGFEISGYKAPSQKGRWIRANWPGSAVDKYFRVSSVIIKDIKTGKEYNVLFAD